MKTVTSLLARVICIPRSVKAFRLCRNGRPHVGRDFKLIPTHRGVLTLALEANQDYAVADSSLPRDIMLRLCSVQDRFDLIADLQTSYVRHRDSLLEVAHRDYRR